MTARATKTKKVTRASKAARPAQKTAAIKPKAPLKPRKTVTAKTLARLPLRVVAFMKTIGEVSEVRALLLPCGYNNAVHQHGWTLLEDVLGRASFTPPPVLDDAPADAPDGPTPVEAAGQIDAWAAPKFGIADAVLRNHHPAVQEYVFAKSLKPATGAKGVLAVKTFLQRLDALGGPTRAAHLVDDEAALHLLGERGITVAERARVRGLVDIVQKGSEPSAAPTANPASLAAKLALYAWHNEWSGIAEKVIDRRDYLIRMGLSTRKKRKRKPKVVKDPSA